MQQNKITSNLNPNQTNPEKNLEIVPFIENEVRNITADAPEDHANIYLNAPNLDNDTSENTGVVARIMRGNIPEERLLADAPEDPTNIYLNDTSENTGVVARIIRANIHENVSEERPLAGEDALKISQLAARCFEKTKNSDSDQLYIFRLGSIRNIWNDQKIFDDFNSDCLTQKYREDFLKVVRNTESRFPHYKEASKFILAKIFQHCHTYHYSELKNIHKSFTSIISAADSSEMDAKKIINFIVYGFIQLDDMSTISSVASIIHVLERNYKDIMYLDQIPQSVSLKLNLYSIVRNSLVSPFNKVLLSLDPTQLITYPVSVCRDMVVSNPRTTLALASTTGVGLLSATGFLTPAFALKIISKVVLTFLSKNKFIKSPTESISEDRDFWFDER
jgi:hypothetical protein